MLQSSCLYRKNSVAFLDDFEIIYILKNLKFFYFFSADLIKWYNSYCSENTIILRRNGDRLEKEDLQTSEFYTEEELIADFNQKNGLFYITPRAEFDTSVKNQENRSMWICARSAKIKNLNGLRLKQGDIFKLGRVAIKIRELTLGPNKCEDVEGVPELDYTDKDAEKQGETKAEKICRICFVPDEDEDNPLFCPCDCSGSMKFIHFECQKQWLKSKMTGKQTPWSYTFNLKTQECELCKTHLPERFQYRKKCFTFQEFPEYEAPYIIFDILRKESKKTRGVHLLKLNYKQNITIGRGSGNDIRMNDISVSRNHAELKLTSSGLILEDKASKFGTLLYVKKNMPILEHMNPICLQVGRSIINCQVKCKWKFVNKLNENNPQIYDDYTPDLAKNALQFKYNEITEEENIIEIADSDEDSESEDGEGDEDDPNSNQNNEDQENIPNNGNLENNDENQGHNGENNNQQNPINPNAYVNTDESQENNNPEIDNEAQALNQNNNDENNLQNN